MDWVGAGGLVVALVGLAFTALTYRRERRVGILEVKQATRARLTAHLELRRRQRVLVVTNSGQGTAQNVVITLDGIPYVQHAAALRNDPPVESIPPQMVASHDLKTDLTTPAPKRIRIDWRNELGDAEFYESIL